MLYNINFNNNETWVYDTEQNCLYDSDKRHVEIDFSYPDDYKRNINEIKISLGLACNYNCAYCSQHPIKAVNVLPYADIKNYVTKLKHFYDNYIEKRNVIKVVLWGGEPLLYFDTFKAVREEILEQFDGPQEVVFTTVTNGKLLTGDRFKYLYDNNVGVGLSYDGPGQYLRNSSEDVLGIGTETRENYITGLTDLQWGLLAVFSKANPSLRDYIYYMRNYLGTETFSIGEANIIRTVDSASRDLVLSDEDLQREAYERYTVFMNDDLYRNVTTLSISDVLRFYKNLNDPAIKGRCNAWYQNHHISVDLAGDSWACHNISGTKIDEYGFNMYKGNILTGERHIVNYEAMKERHETKCRHCLVRYLCAGSCPITEKQYIEDNCKVDFAKFLPIFMFAVSKLADATVLSIEPVIE